MQTSLRISLRTYGKNVHGLTSDQHDSDQPAFRLIGSLSPSFDDRKNLPSCTGALDMVRLPAVRPSIMKFLTLCIHVLSFETK